MKLVKYAIIILLFECNPPRNDQSFWLEGLVGEPIRWIPYFSYPGRDVSWEKQNQVRSRIQEIIRNTKEDLEIHIYGLTDSFIVQEIARAKDRGVRVKIIIDSERSYTELEEMGIPLEVWKGSGLHHPKFIVSDYSRIFTGTGNFTTQGLLKDYDSYLETKVPESMGKQFISFLNEENPSLSGESKGDLWIELGALQFFHSPEYGRHIQKQILDAILGARKSIRYLIYTHYDPVISHALILAARRSVKVEGIYNRPINPEGKYLSEVLPRFGSLVYEEENEDRLDNGSFGLGGLLHHKTMIIDDRILLSGSYNYSRSARDFNREVFYRTKDPQLVQEHILEFERIKKRSKVWEVSTADSQEGERSNPGSEPISLDSLAFGKLDQSKKPEGWVREWGEGIFHSLGVVNPFSLEWSPISSGVLGSENRFREGIDHFTGIWRTKEGTISDPPILPSHRSFSGRINFFGHKYNSEYPKIWRDLFRSPYFIPVEVISWNSRDDEGIVFRIRYPTISMEKPNETYTQGIFLNTDGSLVLGNLKVLSKEKGIYVWEGLRKTVNIGLFFLRNSQGSIDTLACFRLGRRNIPNSYEFIRRENLIQAKIHGYNRLHANAPQSCSVLNRSGF